MHFGSTLSRFRWPVTVASLAVLIATMPVCPMNPTDGLLEVFFNSVVVSAAVFFWQIAPWLFTLTFVGAFLGTYIRGSWNSRLEAYVSALDTSGRTADAERMRGRALHETKWLILQVLLILSLGVFAVLLADQPVFSRDRSGDGARIRTRKDDKTSAASITSLYPFMRNCSCCPPAGQANDATNVSTYPITLYTPPEAFLLALGACALIMLLEWFACYAAFLFWPGGNLKN